MAINVKTDFGAVGNGVNNDSIPIQNAINSVINPLNPDIGGEIYFPDGKYLIEDLLIINQGKNIKLYLEKNAKLFSNKHGHGILEISNSHNISVNGGVFEGRGDFPPKNYGDTHGGGEKFFTGEQGVAWGHHRNKTTQISPGLPAYNGGFIGSCGIGILIRNGSVKINISSTSIQNFNYTGIQVQFLGDSAIVQSNYCKDITIDSNNIQSIYSAGISVHGALGTIVTNNQIVAIGHPDADGSEPIVNPGYGITSRGIRDLNTEGKNTLAANNVILNCRVSGIDSHSSNGVLINANVIENAFINGISLTGTKGERTSAIISSNLISNSGTVSGAGGYGDISGVPKTGIKNTHTNSIITNNIVKNSGVNYGIYNSANNTIIESNNLTYETFSSSGRVICCYVGQPSKISNISIVNNHIGGGEVLSAIYLQNVEKSKVEGNRVNLNVSNELFKMHFCNRIHIGKNIWGKIVFNNGNDFGTMIPEKLICTVEWFGNTGDPIIDYLNYNDEIVIGDSPGLMGKAIKFISGTKSSTNSNASQQMTCKISYINKVGAEYVALVPHISGSQLWCYISARDNSNNVIASDSISLNGLKIQVEIDLFLQT